MRLLYYDFFFPSPNPAAAAQGKVDKPKHSWIDTMHAPQTLIGHSIPVRLLRVSEVNNHTMHH